jgi:hypothetical protein
VLGDANGPSSLAESMSCSVLVATVSHFLELKTELEMPRSGRSADLTEDKADALWT